MKYESILVVRQSTVLATVDDIEWYLGHIRTAAAEGKLTVPRLNDLVHGAREGIDRLARKVVDSYEDYILTSDEAHR